MDEIETPEDQVTLIDPEEQKRITLNGIYNVVSRMNLWEQINTKVEDMGDYIKFSRGSVFISMPYLELMIVGVKTVYKMLKCLDSL